ncbi:MAG: hypothetical protein U0074_08400 [Kouleothrix sp.]
MRGWLNNAYFRQQLRAATAAELATLALYVLVMLLATGMVVALYMRLSARVPRVVHAQASPAATSPA